MLLSRVSPSWMNIVTEGKLHYTEGHSIIEEFQIASAERSEGLRFHLENTKCARSDLTMRDSGYVQIPYFESF